MKERTVFLFFLISGSFINSAWYFSTCNSSSIYRTNLFQNGISCYYFQYDTWSNITSNIPDDYFKVNNIRVKAKLNKKVWIE